MEKLFTVLAVIAGIIIGAVVVYYRSGINQEVEPYPSAQEVVVPASR